MQVGVAKGGTGDWPGTFVNLEDEEVLDFLTNLTGKGAYEGKNRMK